MTHTDDRPTSTSATVPAPDEAASRARAAVERARATYAGGRTRDLGWRTRQLDAIDRLLDDAGAELEAALGEDLGRRAVDASTEISSVRMEIALLRKNLSRWTRARRVAVPLPLGLSRGRVLREPLGTVLVVAPWNYPVHLSLMPVVGALAAGNTVVLKPSEVAPATSEALARLVPRFLETGAVEVVEGGVEQTTALLAERFDHIFYTGNGAVGSIVMAAAARHLTPVTLELGGKSPVWVDDSFPLAATARELAWGKLTNNGQTCVAPDYVLTTADMVQPLVQALQEAITAMYGPDARSNPDYSRIVNIRHTERLAGLLASGQAAIGGEVDVEDRFVAPTVLTEVSLDDPIMQEEIFGPVLPIVTVPDLDAAIEVINGREKPLALYGFTSRPEVRRALLERTSSGGVCFGSNLLQLSVPALPFGGVGHSGMGNYHGEHSIRTFSHERAVLTKFRGPDLVSIARPPFTARKEKLLRR